MEPERTEAVLLFPQPAGKEPLRSQHPSRRGAHHDAEPVRAQPTPPREPGAPEGFLARDPGELVRPRTPNLAGEGIDVSGNLPDEVMAVAGRGEQGERTEAAPPPTNGIPDLGDATPGGADDAGAGYDRVPSEHEPRWLATKSASARTEANAWSATARSWMIMP